MIRSIATFLFLFWSLQAVSAELENQLKHNPSPFLALHGEDPVSWQSWGQEVLVRARAENKPIYISSGYFSCHWCHVMQRESYRNREIAALLNEYFVPVKIDRELLPALDDHLIEFVRRARGNAGWPLNVFLTPDGYPLVGLTYSPPDAFRGVLERVRDAWSSSAPKLGEMARAALTAWSESETLEPFPGDVDRQKLAQKFIQTALSLGDSLEGGFGVQTRFPMSPQWMALLNLVSGGAESPLRALIEVTLDQMKTQGMRDHLGGGFFRYTVDPGWQGPHFEKMLYNQAGLSRLYLRAARVLRRIDYREVARDTLEFAIRVLQAEDGGFISSLSAIDPQDVEGGGYLWAAEELEAALDDRELEFARTRWRLAGENPLDTGFLPIDHHSLDEMAEGSGESLTNLRQMEAGVREKLLRAKSGRRHPRDGKELAAWNGLMLSALAEGAREFGDAGFAAAGQHLRNFLVERLWNGDRLARAMGPNGEIGEAGLEDYAYVAAGLDDWGRYRDSEGDIRLARRLLRDAWRRFFGEHGWRTTDKTLLPGFAAEPMISDGALPSPSAMVIRLSLESGDEALVTNAKRALRVGYIQAVEEPLWHASHVDLLLQKGFGESPIAQTGAMHE